MILFIITIHGTGLPYANKEKLFKFDEAFEMVMSSQASQDEGVET